MTSLLAGCPCAVPDDVATDREVFDPDSLYRGCDKVNLHHPDLFANPSPVLTVCGARWERSGAGTRLANRILIDQAHRQGLSEMVDNAPRLPFARRGKPLTEPFHRRSAIEIGRERVYTRPGGTNSYAPLSRAGWRLPTSHLSQTSVRSPRALSDPRLSSRVVMQPSPLVTCPAGDSADSDLGPCLADQAGRRTTSASPTCA